MGGNSLLSRYKEEHELYLKKILKLIYTSDYKNIIGFKGGTLAFLKYGLTRFSTDIDIDLIDKTKEQDVIEFFDDNFIEIGSVEKVLGKDLHRRRIRYEMGSRIIKVELNKRNNPYTQYETIKIDDFDVVAQTPTSMFSNKVCALGARRYNRDLYDIDFFLKQGYSMDRNLVEEQTGMMLEDWIKYLIENIPNHFPENNILHQLGEVLEEKQKPWVKKNLVAETTRLLKEYIK